MIVGEAPGGDEVRAGRPFVGAAGKELRGWLARAEIDADQVRIANVCKWRPPGNNIDKWFHTKTAGTKKGLTPLNGKYAEQVILDGVSTLWQEIRRVRPKAILALGNTALWALTGEWGITKWRGSHMHLLPEINHQALVIPTYHPAGVLRTYKWRATALQDISRLARELRSETPEPSWQFILQPTIPETVETLDWLIQDRPPIAVDIETRAGHIACIGLAWSEHEALCIPLMQAAEPYNYWAQTDEQVIIRKLRTLLAHPRQMIYGQNYVYDAQYLWRWYGIWPHHQIFDTMIAHHLCFPTLPKGLDYLSSVYCSWHYYWKDEGKLFDIDRHDERQLWRYNCLDACRTFEIANEIPIDACNLRLQFDEKMHWWRLLFKAMVKGVRQNPRLRSELLNQLQDAGRVMERRLARMVSAAVWPPKPKAKPWYRSTHQQRELFYDVLGVRPVINRKTGRPTVDDDALATVGRRMPILAPVVGVLAEYRSLNVVANVLKSPLDSDGRMRCSYNLAGTTTHRLSSSENAFGSGTNLQNITKGNPKLGTPNLRRLFIPDPGCGFLEADLAQADAHIVAWEAADEPLMQFFTAARTDDSLDLHGQNASDIYGGPASRANPHRQKAKAAVHAINYGVRAKTLATTLGITVHEAEGIIARWFRAHPAIHDWQQSVAHAVETTGTLTNVFGYTITFYDRVDHRLIHQALAWVGQSTVAIIINKAWQFVSERIEWAEVVFQTHDSLTLQFPRQYFNRRDEIRQAMEVHCPFPAGELVIPLDAAWSTESWGDVKEVSWS